MGASGSATASASRTAARERGARGAVVPGVPRLEVAASAVAALAAVVWALWLPPVRDLAGQQFRVGQFEALGPHVWNNLWYGGHHTPGYSAAFAPVAATLGVGLTGVIAAAVAAWCFAALLRRYAGSAAIPGALWFALATTTSLFSGRMPFAMGTALAIGACLAAQRSRPVLAGILGIAAGATSGVAAAFVALAGVALAIGSRAPGHRRLGVVLAVAPTATVLAIGLAFPVDGNADFGPVMLVGSVAAGVAVWAAAPPTASVLRTGALLYVGACVVGYLVPSPIGGTLGRLGALVAGPLVLTLLLARLRDGKLPRLLQHPLGVAGMLVALGGAIAWQWGPARLDVHDATAAPYVASTREAFYAPLVAQVRERSGGPVRVEIPLTATHQEARWVAPHVPLARGWLRQLDHAHNALFYDGTLTPAAYARWLRDSGVRWVALPAAPLDRSAVREARIVRSRPAYLREVWRSPDWRLFRVAGSPGLVSGPGRLESMTGNALVLRAERPGRFVVRVRHTRYWTVVGGAACIARGPGDWTAVRVARPGRVRITARIGSVARLGRQPQCPERAAASVQVGGTRSSAAR